MDKGTNRCNKKPARGNGPPSSLESAPRRRAGNPSMVPGIRSKVYVAHGNSGALFGGLPTTLVFSLYLCQAVPRSSIRTWTPFTPFCRVTIADFHLALLIFDLCFLLRAGRHLALKKSMSVCACVKGFAVNQPMIGMTGQPIDVHGLGCRSSCRPVSTAV